MKTYKADDGIIDEETKIEVIETKEFKTYTNVSELKRS